MHADRSLPAPRLLPPLLLLAAAAGAQAQGTSCEELRASIEARIASAGVSRFSVTVLPMDAATEARVVGTCELGSRKIVYVREPSQPLPAAAPAPRPGGAQERILTECRDGSVSMGGSCKP
ncbi:DUF1161 domain-containing protein [Xenophilus azovorans]|uniref:DUF1161 domain-containing protein n=1 Tax=Xenophilus TaxID=151754 RepID=UPI000571078C|nr:DUF1161 domain-containing protein [Xenophilus azovorans]